MSVTGENTTGYDGQPGGCTSGCTNAGERQHAGPPNPEASHCGGDDTEGAGDFAEALTMLARLPGLTDAERAEAVRQLLAAQRRRDEHPERP